MVSDLPGMSLAGEEISMMLDFFRNSSVLVCREVIVQRTRHVVAEPGIAAQSPTCSRHQVCLKSSFPSSSLQGFQGFSIARDSRRSPPRQPSSSFFTVLPEGCSSRSKKYECLIHVSQNSAYVLIHICTCIVFFVVPAITLTVCL